MLDDYIKEKGLAAFNVNMDKNNRTLHINAEIVGKGKKEIYAPDGSLLPYKKCPSQKPFRFISFNSLKDVEAFEKAHACSFRRCGNCFPKIMRGN